MASTALLMACSAAGGTPPGSTITSGSLAWTCPAASANRRAGQTRNIRRMRQAGRTTTAGSLPAMSRGRAAMRAATRRAMSR
ncbi:Uncharacterised protein [Bordetella pertussis]|nr:Uncharacterised protein [Bordetella pertussis]CFP64579.1 Uncharacterised protein [Bordetella pertussis]